MNNNKKRSISLGVLLAGIGGALVIGLLAVQTAAADSVAGEFQIILVSDDIRKGITPTYRPGDGDADDGGGNGNNGHGNNEDGVDSSNPGQGGGGPNGATDPSGDYDDEGTGGGASPSKK